MSYLCSAFVGCMMAAAIAGDLSAGTYSMVGDSGWQSLTSNAGLSWRAVSSNGSVAVPATVPGQIHLDLHAAGVIGDTYYRFNQAANAWVYQDSWTFEVNFTLAPDIASAVENGEAWLVFDGIDTLGAVELNVPPPPPRPPANASIGCFTKVAHTSPNPRTPYFRRVTVDERDECATLCLADNDCGGFTMSNPSGPSSKDCYIFHRPPTTPISNGTGFRDVDWYQRQIDEPLCDSPAPACAGCLVAQTEDQFLRYAYPASHALRGGGQPNTLRVTIASVASLGTSGYTAVRKAPTSFGTDWGPTTETSGVWLPVYLIGQAKLVLLDMVATVVGVSSNPLNRLTADTAAWRVNVTTRVNVSSPSQVRLVIEGNWTTERYETTRALPAGVSTLTHVLNVSSDIGVALWWPRGYGAQPLYTVTTTATGVAAVSTSLAFGSVSASRSIGFRTVNMRAKPAERDGRPDYGPNSTLPVQTYRVNGVDIFAKGADWIPPDSFEGRVRHDDDGDGVLCSLLQSVADSNMNFVRIWGGGIFPQDAFFDCADRAGILLQQDGIFSGLAYPTTPEFLGLLTQELQYQARRLASHPSLFLWSGSNEEYAGAVGGWWDAVFLDTMFPALSSVDRSRPVWAACPALPWATGVDDGGLPTGEPFTVLNQSRGMADRGSRHPLGAETHEYWFKMCDTLASCQNCVDDSFYLDTVFASEFGWIGMPSLESLSPYLSSELGDYTVMSPAMVARQNHIVQQRTVANMVEWNMGALSAPYITASDAESFRRVIHMSQVAQADCLRAEAEHYRRGRDFAQRTGGSLFWMLEDIWPAPSWAAIEYGGRRGKLLYYEATRFYSTIAMSSYCLPSIENCTAVDIHITSDLIGRGDLAATLQVNLTRWRDGASTTVMLTSLSIPSQNGTTVQLNASRFTAAFRVAGCANTSECFLTSRLLGSGSSSGSTVAPDNHQWLTLWRDARLSTASLQIQARAAGGKSDGTVEVTVSSNQVAPSVMVHCGKDTDFGWFNDNGLLVRPDAPVTITYTPRPGQATRGPASRPHTPCTAPVTGLEGTSGFYAVSVNGISKYQ